MTAKIKLNAASGGGSFSLQAPSSSANNRVFTLPDSADATILTSTTATGKILQVVNSTTTTSYTHSSATYGDMGLSASITPQTNSKVLVLLSLQYFIENYKNEGFGVKILRDSTAVFTSSQVYHIYGFSNASGTNVETKSKVSYHILDSSVGGNGSSSLTYKLQVGTYQGNGVAFSSNGASSELTLLEIGA